MAQFSEERMKQGVENTANNYGEALTVGLLLSVSLAWPDDKPSSKTGILEYRRIVSTVVESPGPPGPTMAVVGSASVSKRETSLSKSPQLESQSVVSGDNVKLRLCPTYNSTKISSHHPRRSEKFPYKQCGNF